MRRANILLKIALIPLFVHAITQLSELPQFESKGIGLRLGIYSVVILGWPILWRISAELRRRLGTYPHFVDACVSFVVASDLFGNVFDLYDTIWWWDDVMHLLLVVPWALAGGYFVRKLPVQPAIVGALTFGYGVFSSVVWEIYEYFASTRSGRIEGVTGYPDTIGDLILAIIGSLIASILMFEWLKKRRK